MKHYMPAWDQSDGVWCSSCNEDATLCACGPDDTGLRARNPRVRISAMVKFDKIAFEIEPEMYPGKFAAKVVLYHRGVTVYSEVFARDLRFTPLIAKVIEQCQIEASKVARHKYEADPTELPPTTRVQ